MRMTCPSSVRNWTFRKQQPGCPVIDGKGITKFLLSRE